MFPKQIKYLRQSRALSQVQLADKLGVKKPEYQQLGK